MPQDEPLLPRLFAVARAAQYLGMSEKALRGRVYRKEIPFVRVHRRLFFDRFRLEQWIDAHFNGLPMARGPWRAR